MPTRLMNDVARATTKHVMQVVNVTDEEYRTLHDLVLERIIGGLLAFEEFKRREQKRLGRGEAEEGGG